MPATKYTQPFAAASLSTLSPTGAATKLFLLTIFLLPLHTLVIYRALPLYTGLPADAVSMWKEIALLVVALVFLADMLISHEPLVLSPLDVAVTLFICLLAVYVIGTVGGRERALYGLRIFAEPFAVFYLARSVRISMAAARRYLKYMFYLGVAISMWAIFQAAVLGDQFLVDMGYKNAYGRLYTAFYVSGFQFQRAAGTFSSPNTFGLYIQAMIMLGVYLYRHRNILGKKRYFLSMIVLLSALQYSFSRSSWLALTVSMLAFIVIKMDPKKVAGIAAKTLIILVVLVTAVYALAPDLLETMATYAANTFTLRDSSAQGHMASWSESYQFMTANPFGIGLGMSGPRAGVRGSGVLNSENSFFIVTFDLGVFGVFLYTLIMLMLVALLFAVVNRAKDADSKRFRMVALSIFIGQVIAWNFLPFIHELEATVVLFFLAGLALNRSVENDDKQAA